MGALLKVTEKFRKLQLILCLWVIVSRNIALAQNNQQIHSVNSFDHSGHNAQRSQPRQFYCWTQTKAYDCIFRDVVLSYNPVGVAFGNPQYTQYKKSVSFVDSRMDYLPKSLMDAFPNLETLNAIFLQIRSLQPAAFEFSSKLERVYLADNLIDRIERESFRGAPNIAVLALERNKINYFEYNALGIMQNLRALYISSNEIPSLPSLSNSPSLETVNASQNSLTRIDDDHFMRNLELRNLDLSFNQLTMFNMEQLHGKAKLYSVDVSSNYIKYLVIPTHVRKLLAINNSVEMVFTHQKQCFVQELSLAQNKLSQQPDLKECRSLKKMDLSYNLLESFNFGSLQSFVYLTHVNLMNNHILQIDLPTEFYYPLPITHLELSSNLLSFVPNTNVLAQLVELHLHNNKLEKFDFQNKPNLRFLTLSYNQWDCVALDGIEFNVIDRQQEQCTTGFRNRGICCQSSDAQDSQNLQNLKDFIREASTHELQNKKSIDKQCRPQIQQQLAANEINNRLATISNLEATKEPIILEIAQVQDGLNRLDDQIAARQRDTRTKNDQIAFLAKEVDRWRAVYGIEKEGLVDAKHVLQRIVTFLEARKENSAGLLKRRQEEVLARKGEADNNTKMEISGRKDLDQLKQVLSDLKVKEQTLKTLRNALAAQVNNNAASLRGSSSF